ncbi:MAG: hypothetical protein U0T36_07490 [Saprospiraceae bacterium]
MEVQPNATPASDHCDATPDPDGADGTTIEYDPSDGDTRRER